MSSRVCIDIIALLAQWSVVCPEVGSDNRTCLVQRYSRPIRLFTPQWTFIVCWGFEPMHEISVEFATFRHTIHGDIPWRLSPIKTWLALPLRLPWPAKHRRITSLDTTAAVQSRIQQFKEVINPYCRWLRDER